MIGAVKADGSPKGRFLSIIGIAEVIEKDGKIYRHDPNDLSDKRKSLKPYL